MLTVEWEPEIQKKNADGQEMNYQAEEVTYGNTKYPMAVIKKKATEPLLQFYEKHYFTDLDFLETIEGKEAGVWVPNQKR